MNTNLTNPSSPAQSLGNRFWLCWSPQQNCFHIESEAEGLRTNQDAFAEDSKVDYVPIGIFHSREAADATASRFRDEMEQRQLRAAMTARQS